jgi:acyl carrier protein
MRRRSACILGGFANGTIVVWVLSRGARSVARRPRERTRPEVDAHSPVSESITFEARRIIAETLRAPIESVGLDATLDESRLGVDSLALIKLNVVLEERFDITIPDFVATEATAPRSVRDVVAIVASRVAARRGGAS